MTTRGAIAAGHRLTAEAGAAVLRRGGNAVDAAIAAIAMACVCEPVLCSPGGGAFAMVRSADDGAIRVFDAFVQTPVRRAEDLDDGAHDVEADFGTARQRFRIGPATTATPGLFHGLAALATAHGSVPLIDLVADAAEAARRGIEITPFQHHLATVVTPILTGTPATRALFAPDGDLLPSGSRFRNPGLADALEILAADGVSASAVGSAMVEQQHGRGHVSADDLGRYAVVERAPFDVFVDGARVHLNPLPAAGGLLVGHTLHRLSSTAPVDIAQALDETDRARREFADDLGALAAVPQRQRGTTQVSVIDATGSACSITASNGEGNGELVDGFGFMLNNMLGEDDVNTTGDEWPLDVRLSSMMCPTIIEHDDGAITALGSGGSSRIRSAISQVVAFLCVDGSELRAAIDAPRLHVEGGHLDIEPRADEREVAELRTAFADQLVWPGPDLFFGGVHAVRRHADGHFDGAGDGRRHGAAEVIDGGEATTP